MVTPKSFTKIEHKGIYTLRTNPRKGPVLRTTNDRHARSSYIDKADVLSELRGELFCHKDESPSLAISIRSARVWIGS